MTVVDQMRAWREQGEALKEQARLRRLVLVAELAEIDATLGDEVAAPPATSAPRPERQSPAPRARASGGSDKILAGLKELAPWLPGLRDKQRKVIGLRLSGKSTTEIAAQLGATVKDVSNAVHAGRARLRELRSRGAPAPKPANDSEEEAEPAAQPAPVDWSLLGADSQGYVGPLSSSFSPSTEEGKEEQPDDFAGIETVPLAELPALVAAPPRAAPGVEAWILDRLLPAWWTAYQGIVVEKCHPDVVAYLNGTTAQEVSRKAKAAEIQIERLKVWEAGREADGLPLTDEDKAGTAPAAPDPLLAALGIKQVSKSLGDAKRDEMASMREHFHRLAPRQVQLAELYIAGKTFAEIAAEMGIRIPTVNNNLNATRARLEGCARYTPPAEIERPELPSIASVHGTQIKRANKFRELAEYFAVLPPEERSVVDLAVQGITNEAMARTLGITAARFSTVIRRAEDFLQAAANPSQFVDPRKVAPLEAGRVRGHTIAPTRLTRAERRQAEELQIPGDVQRPRTRGDCEEGVGNPCPFVSCSHHLYLDVNPETGAIKLNFPHLEVWEMAETCSLDVADRGGITLEEVGAILNLTRERIRQVEISGLARMKKRSGEMEDPADRRGSALAEAINEG